VTGDTFCENWHYRRVRARAYASNARYTPNASPVTRSAMTPRARIASQGLTRGLLNLAARGIRPRCSDPATHGYWLSEHKAERDLAARWCHGCPVLTECLAAAKANREQWGVWGAVDFSRRPGQKATAA
jgi:Transcription factor WhiB